jgi:beta-fructofuranosidase
MNLYYDAARGVVTVDRTGMNKRFNTKVFEVLDMPLSKPLTNLRIFIDRCSVELFANDGEATFTTHLYPTEEEFHFTATDNVTVKGWTYKPSVKDDFVV